MAFISLHTHSVFSFHAGVCTVHELVARAKAMGMGAIALTDVDRMSGLIQFYGECKEQGIKPILGVELTQPGTSDGRVVLLAKNAMGYADLCEIITQRHVHEKEFTFKKVFSKAWENVFFITAFPRVLELLADTPNRARLYGELVNNSSLTRERSKLVVQASQSSQNPGVPLIVSNDPYFLDKEDWETHKILVAIGKISTLSRLKPGEYASESAWLKPGEAMQALFPNHKDAIDNTQKIADQCRADLDLGTWIMPYITVPGNDPNGHLAGLAYAGLNEHYGNKDTFERARQIQAMELEVIKKLDYASYFLIVKDIRDWAGSVLQNGYRRPKDCTVLRGSAANSMTFYNIGVSDLDPIKYDLYFQRFLNEDRASPPDADLDFGWDEREQALDHLIEKWGREHVAITCTTNHFRRRAAFREIAKVFGHTEEQITKILKSHKTQTKRIMDDEIRHLLFLAEKIRGKPRFLGQHPGGVLITNGPIWRRVACEYSGGASGGAKNRIITQIDMHSGIDELGLIKFDILGNGSLSVLRDTLAQLKDQGLPDPRVWNLEKCYADPAVREIVGGGRTKGIFYIESPAQTRLNKKAQAQTFEEITITSSLIRPAGATYTKTFVERHRKMKEGIIDWEYLHPSLEPILKESHDVCAFQEHVTKICHSVAGLTYKKADKIRKMMNSLHDGALTSDEYATASREFMDGCMGHSGLTREQALRLWERVSSFTGFSFCKSHSASYAQLSFKCTFLKAYYPAQFLSAVISNNHGFYSREVYLDEARRWGIRILPMNVNESRVQYFGKHNWIRPGFMHILGVSGAGLERIVEERGLHGPYRNLVDFINRVPVGRKDIENLILTGAFDGFGLTQPESLFLLDDVYKKARPDEPGLFGAGIPLARDFLHPGLSDYTLAQRCFNELRLLGFMLSGNILDILDLHPAAKGAVPMDKVKNCKGKRIKVFGWMITNRIHVTGSDKHMMFITLEDATECVDVILWPDIYNRYCDVIAGPGPFEVWGRVSEDWGAYTVEAQRIVSVEWLPGQVDFERASKRLGKSFTKDYMYDDIPKTHAA
jgi:DNA-directed DNA polymerase III PolC